MTSSYNDIVANRPKYEPFDQDRHLPEPPWSDDDVRDWEAAHGHDCRLKCYPEFGCQVIEPHAYWRGWRDALSGLNYDPESE